MKNAQRLLIACLLTAPACVDDNPETTDDRPSPAPELTMEAAQMAADIDSALQRLTDSIIDIPGVTGTAIGECEGQPCITVLLESKTEDLMNRIPDSWDGFTIKIEESGTISPRGTTE